MSLLVLAEHDNAALKAVTQHTVTAARKIGEKADASEIHLLVMGHQADSVAAAAARIEGVTKVILADAAELGSQTAEVLTAQVLLQVQAEKYSHVLAPATTYGKNLSPRIAAKLDVQQISGIIDVLSPNTFVRPIYAGNALATVESVADALMVLTVLSTGFDSSRITETSVPIEPAKELAKETAGVRLVGRQLASSDKIELTAARVVVSGGRGLQKAENFRLLEALATKLNAAVGASRAAVDAGFVPNDYQVGQTGKIVAPELYIAVGISGAIQHLAGMRDSKVIVAINKDPDAPIFQVADYGLVGDALEILPQLTALL
ncbi:MAG TPA: FAD-binding protein [Chthoniobacterales bacterium]|jgi:electron transfer flavoprotein alpha subunit